MSADAALVAPLRELQEPELRRSIVELGMVKGAALERGVALVALALPLAPADGGGALRARVVEALQGVEGVTRVEVDLRPMTDPELEAVAGILKGADPLRLVDAAGSGRPPEARRNPFTDSRTRVLAIASGKGGVGKSSVTTNLAVALAQRGHDVAALDADVWGFSMPRMLGVDRSPGIIGDVIVPPAAHGVRLISMGFFAREDQAEVVVVTTPQPAAQKVAQRAAAMARKVNLSVVGVVENMSWFRGDDGTAYEIFGSGGGEELAHDLEVPLLGRVPLVAALREGGDEGRPIVVADPADEAAVAFRAIAEQIDVAMVPRRRHHPELRIT